MELCDLLRIPRGVTCLIGGGGKTTALALLGRELSRRGRVILCTTTHIRPVAGFPLAPNSQEGITETFQHHPALCVGTPAEEGKLTAPAILMDRLRELADYVLVEADGARHCPCKAHAPHEPVIPPETAFTLLLLGAGGFGRPISECAHRPERYAPLAGAKPEDPITPERAARVLLAEDLHDAVFINQMESPRQEALARRLAALLPCPVYGGALQKGVWKCLS